MNVQRRVNGGFEFEQPLEHDVDRAPPCCTIDQQFQGSTFFVLVFLLGIEANLVLRLLLVEECLSAQIRAPDGVHDGFGLREKRSHSWDVECVSHTEM